ncbi:hypothetical protein ABZ639_27120 [Saccharomonospora sp. NPDC006951]
MTNDRAEGGNPSGAAELAEWASRSGRDVDLGEATVLLTLLDDELDIGDLAELRVGDIEELLLDVYPDVVEVDDEDDIERVTTTMRALLTFGADTGRIPAKRHDALASELDTITPALDEAMLGTEEEIDLKEAYGLPDTLGPLRLPSADELAGAARTSALLARTRELAEWFGEGRPLTADGEVSPEDVIAVAEDLELSETDLTQLLALAEDIDFIAPSTDTTGTAAADDAGTIALGEGADLWPDGSAEDVLDVWCRALTACLAWSLLADAERAGETDLEFAAAGVWFMPLFLARAAGLPVTQVEEMIKEVATADLTIDKAEQAWASWVAEHGDPAEVLLTRLAELGAVELFEDTDNDTGEVEYTVVATPLAMHAMRLELVDSAVEIPLLPPYEEMTAADLIAVGGSGLDDELDDEFAAWLDRRDAASAVTELMAVVTEGGPAERLVGSMLVRALGAEAESRWRAAIDDPNLRAYAKLALLELEGERPEWRPEQSDLAWLVADSLAAAGSEVAPEELAETLPADNAGLIDELWRIDHPDAHRVLTMLGQHPDKAIAKAARKAAFKAADRLR